MHGLPSLTKTVRSSVIFNTHYSHAEKSNQPVDNFFFFFKSASLGHNNES